MEDVMAGYSWKDVKDIVRSGEGERKFPLGTQFPVRKIEEDGKERIILFDVVDHDRHPVQDGTHSMLLLIHRKNWRPCRNRSKMHRQLWSTIHPAWRRLHCSWRVKMTLSLR